MEIFEVLSDPTRRRIVELLAEGDHAAGELAEEFTISQPGISRHLRVLREAGVVTSRAEGRRRVYSLRSEPLEEIDSWLEARKSAWAHRLDALAIHLAERSR